MKPINIKLLTTILMPMLLIPLVGFGYSHWTDSVTKQIKMHVRCPEATIKSYKCVSEFDDDWIDKDPAEDEVPPGGFSTLTIRTDRAFPGWYVWIGLLIQNQGPLPVEVDVPEYKVTMNGEVSYTTKEYFYGPYTNDEWITYKKTYWETITWKYLKEKGEPPGDSKTPPIELEPSGPSNRNRMVMWIYIEIIDGQEGFDIEIEMTLRTELALP